MTFHDCPGQYLNNENCFGWRKALLILQWNLVIKRQGISLVQALYTLSRLDYGNSLLANINASDVKRLQNIQNRAARLVLGARRRVRSAPLLKQLHWLPVKERIDYKLALLVYKCMMSTAPQYLSSILTMPVSSRYFLRSQNDKTLLQIPRRNTKAAECSFSYAGPVIWNTLPQHLRLCDTEDTFKKKLKTQFFPS